jgi:phosphatidylglycerophosphatase A
MHPKIATFIATVSYVGYMRKAPGTWGSVAGVILAWPILALFGLNGLAVASVLVFLLGWWAANVYERTTGRHDPKEIVVDEVVGQWLTMLLAVVVTVGWFQCFGEGEKSELSMAERFAALDHLLRTVAWYVIANPEQPRIWVLFSIPAFAFFRLFDIRKPGPIGRLDRTIGGGLGTMVDDALAGVVAALPTGLCWVLIFYWAPKVLTPGS